MFLDVSGCFSMFSVFPNVSRCFSMFLNVSRCVSMCYHHPAGRSAENAAPSAGVAAVAPSVM